MINRNSPCYYDYFRFIRLIGLSNIGYMFFK